MATKKNSSKGNANNDTTMATRATGGKSTHSAGALVRKRAPSTASRAKHAKPSKAAKGDASAPIALVTNAAKARALADELAPLAKMGKTELWKLYEKVFGHKTASCNTTHLRSAIAKKLEDGKGSHTSSKVARGEHADTPANGVTVPTDREALERDPRLPPVGTFLERTHNGFVHKVKVLDDGFEYMGKKHRSLSGLAKLITGAIWNGWAWFGLAAKPLKMTAPVVSSSRVARSSAASNARLVPVKRATQSGGRRG